MACFLVHFVNSFPPWEPKIWGWWGSWKQTSVSDMIFRVGFNYPINVNSLAPGRCGWNLKLIIFNLILRIDIYSISFEIALKWMQKASVIISQYLNQVDLSSKVFHSIHLRANSKEIPMNLICNLSSEIKFTFTIATTSPRDQRVDVSLGFADIVAGAVFRKAETCKSSVLIMHTLQSVACLCQVCHSYSLLTT